MMLDPSGGQEMWRQQVWPRQKFVIRIATFGLDVEMPLISRIQTNLVKPLLPWRCSIGLYTCAGQLETIP
jgi:hypothetical protein